MRPRCARTWRPRSTTPSQRPRWQRRSNCSRTSPCASSGAPTCCARRSSGSGSSSRPRRNALPVLEEPVPHDSAGLLTSRGAHLGALTAADPAEEALRELLTWQLRARGRPTPHRHAQIGHDRDADTRGVRRPGDVLRNGWTDGLPIVPPTPGARRGDARGSRRHRRADPDRRHPRARQGHHPRAGCGTRGHGGLQSRRTSRLCSRPSRRCSTPRSTRTRR